MNRRLCKMLNEAIETYNDYAGEYDQLYWWDVLNEINDMTDDEEVLNVIIRIERQADKLIAKEAAGY